MTYVRQQQQQSESSGATDQLQRGEVSLPPKVLLHVRANRSQAVIRVHDDVNEGVYKADEESCGV